MATFRGWDPMAVAIRRLAGSDATTSYLFIFADPIQKLEVAAVVWRDWCVWSFWLSSPVQTFPNHSDAYDPVVPTACN